MKKYGLLTYETDNIGDDIQSLAAEQFLPKVDYYIQRDRIGYFKSRHKVHVIMNGWFLHKIFHFKNSKNYLKHALHKIEKRFFHGFYSWPPPSCVQPLFISFHATGSKSECGSITNQHFLKYYKKYQPIGCRDNTTLKAFTALGVDAYFSGCLTLTLKRENLARTEDVCFVDPFGPRKGTYLFPLPGEPEFPNELFEKFPADIRRSACYMTHHTDEKDPQKRLKYAKELIAKYSKAKLVITSRLHCALPCIALGTPVIFIKTEHDVGRYDGLINLFLPNAYTLEEIRNSRSEINVNLNSIDQNNVQALAENLRKRCEEFVK